MFNLFLGNAYIKSGTFQLLIPPWQQRGWGCTWSRERTQQEQLTQTGQRDISHLLMLCGEIKLGGLAWGLLLIWLGIHWRVASSCVVLHLFCIIAATTTTTTTSASTTSTSSSSSSSTPNYIPFIFCSNMLTLS